MRYIRRTRDTWRIEVNYGYGHGWEYEIAEDTWRDARQRLREYRENCDYPVRARLVREKIGVTIQ